MLGWITRPMFMAFGVYTKIITQNVGEFMRHDHNETRFWQILSRIFMRFSSAYLCVNIRCVLLDHFRHRHHCLSNEDGLFFYDGVTEARRSYREA